MRISMRVVQRLVWIGAAIQVLAMVTGCGNMPREYRKMAEPNVTLTALMASPKQYYGKVLLMGGVLVEEEQDDQYVWLRMKNRPLDEDDIPRRPIEPDGPEAGHSWLKVLKAHLPPGYHHWARMSLAGRVTSKVKLGHEPVLRLLYARHWGIDEGDGEWRRDFDPNYDFIAPAGIGIEMDIGSE